MRVTKIGKTAYVAMEDVLHQLRRLYPIGSDLRNEYELSDFQRKINDLMERYERIKEGMRY